MKLAKTDVKSAALVLQKTLTQYLAEEGVADPITKAARQVVWARHYSGDDGWDRLSEAIGELEDLVGRPESEPNAVPFVIPKK